MHIDAWLLAKTSHDRGPHTKNFREAKHLIDNLLPPCTLLHFYLDGFISHDLALHLHNSLAKYVAASDPATIKDCANFYTAVVNTLPLGQHWAPSVLSHIKLHTPSEFAPLVIVSDLISLKIQGKSIKVLKKCKKKSWKDEIEAIDV
jgi:hypothetical protein